MEKVCTECNRSKSLDEFHKAKYGKLGRTAKCKECVSLRYKRIKHSVQNVDPPLEKQCVTCKISKPLEEFYKNKIGKYGREANCKECYNEKMKQRLKQKIKRLEKHCPKCSLTKKRSEWPENKWSRDGLGTYCKECERIRAKKRRKNPEVKAKIKKYNTSSIVKKRKREWLKERTNSDESYKIAPREKNRVRIALKKQNASTNLKQDERLGCSISEFKEWLELHFKEGMSWDNYGTKWHIDHIAPLSWFDLTDVEQQMEAFHYTNQQPMWAKENLSKGNRFIG